MATLNAIITAAWTVLTDGALPTKIDYLYRGQAGKNKYYFYDESILTDRVEYDFSQPGMEQYHEKDVSIYEVYVATLTSIARFTQIVNAIRRICLAFSGDEDFSRLHLDNIPYEKNNYYYIGVGSLRGQINLTKKRE